MQDKATQLPLAFNPCRYAVVRYFPTALKAYCTQVMYHQNGATPEEAIAVAQKNDRQLKNIPGDKGEIYGYVRITPDNKMLYQRYEPITRIGRFKNAPFD